MVTWVLLCKYIHAYACNLIEMLFSMDMGKNNDARETNHCGGSFMVIACKIIAEATTCVMVYYNYIWVMACYVSMLRLCRCMGE